MVAAIVLAGSVGGCGKAATTSAAQQGWQHYTLFTHCGITNANIAGQWYDATPPLSDGQGNPPKGWHSPSQDGQIRFLSSTRVDFRDSAGHQVLFVLRPATAGPIQPCS